MAASDRDIKDQCYCMLDAYMGKYSDAQFLDIESKMISGDTDREFIEFSTKAIMNCVFP